MCSIQRDKDWSQLAERIAESRVNAVGVWEAVVAGPLDFCAWVASLIGWMDAHD
jgi:hypothetical protein